MAGRKIERRGRNHDKEKYGKKGRETHRKNESEREKGELRKSTTDR